MGRQSPLSEARFEDVVVETLAASPFYRLRPADAFDAERLLDIAETCDFVRATHPKEWAKLAKQFAGQEAETLAGQLAALIQKRGTLDVLRGGIAFNGINLQLAYFRPSGAGNPEHQARYEANRFAVMRQVHFSPRTPDQSVDVVILLNGLPIVCVELKNHFTGQNVQHAIGQYRRRDPKEGFWQRCLVHFAVDDDADYMTARVNGKETNFLPSINQAFIDNADEFLNFMGRTQTDPAFGKFFFSEMFKWYAQAAAERGQGSLEA